MQELQNVHLQPSTSNPTESELTRADQVASLRKRKLQAEHGGNVRFSTIFSMVDSGLDLGAESLRRIPKRSAQKESDGEKSQTVVPIAQADVKVQTAETAKETAKAKVEPETKPKAAKEAAKKQDHPELAAAHFLLSQAKADPQAARSIRPAERDEIKVDRKSSTEMIRSKGPEKSDRPIARKDRQAEIREETRQADVTEKAVIAEQSKSPERKQKAKGKDDESRGMEVRETRREPDDSKSRRIEDESSRQAKVRDRGEVKPVVQERSDNRDAQQADKRPIGDDSEQRQTEEAGRGEPAGKKRTTGDLEKLTGLTAKTVMELAPVVVQTPDVLVKPVADASIRSLGIDAVRPAIRSAGTAGSSGAHQQQSTGAETQSQASQTKEKLGETARRLGSYLSGKVEQMVKPEATFSDMVAKAKLFFDNGRSEMTIQLKPDQLGSLNIKIAMEDGHLEAYFVTDRPEVKALIEQNADLLKSKLAEVGIEVQAMSVEVRSDTGAPGTQDGREGGLRKVLEFGGSEETETRSGSSQAAHAYALAGIGTHLSMVA